MYYGFMMNHWGVFYSRIIKYYIIDDLDKNYCTAWTTASGGIARVAALAIA